jgi:hypothetical protein
MELRKGETMKQTNHPLWAPDYKPTKTEIAAGVVSGIVLVAGLLLALIVVAAVVTLAILIF